MLKYLSIKLVIDSPKTFKRIARKKNRALLLIELAKINIKKFKSNAPALTVNILNGIGVNPAVNIIRKLY